MITLNKHKNEEIELDKVTKNLTNSDIDFSYDYDIEEQKFSKAKELQSIKLYSNTAA